jgi:hypothetical protein
VRGLGAAVAFAILCVSASPLSAAERYALIVTGASGGTPYAENYETWRARFEAILREDFGYPSGHVVVLSEDADEGRRSTREDVRTAFTELGRLTQDDDVVLVLLMGHGSSFYADAAKFNLVGPDLTAGEWAQLMQLIPGRLVFVNSTGASFPFLERVSGPNRIVVTATDSAFQQYDTVFPELFVSAFADSAADVDKNDRVSIWEAFSYASVGVTDWFEARGRLATERPLMDDTGDGIGSEATSNGPDGELARATFLEPDVPAAASGNAALVAIYERRADIESRLERLKADKANWPPEQYEEQLESLLLELAVVDHELREIP